MGTGSLRLQEGGPNPTVSDGVLWLLWVLSQIFADYARAILQGIYVLWA